MYFKKLEIVGFKSFAQKTSLYFEPGVTTVVGPNGCGKSNIIDAIRWVLGEQSVKSLRGSKMEDVIFNGTEETEPINMADVSLALSNKDKLLPIDADEVVISRKLFRSGESEYFINKTPVRLKDVSELLMGTGIGAEAYSIIGQGKIDLILSSRPEERRFIFEEASGITKYKSKKKEAIRKLEDTDNNLLRVSDIITEVKRQINSIIRQAKKAERYKERFDRLKELETKLALYEYGSLKNQRQELESLSANVHDEIERFISEIEHLKRQLENEKSSLSEIDKKYGELQNSKFSKESFIKQNRSRIDMDKERIAEFSARIEALREEIDSLSSRIEGAEKLIQELESSLSDVLDSEGTKKEILNDKELALQRLESEIRHNEKRIEESKQLMVDYMDGRSKSRNEVIKLTSDIQNRSARARRLSLELEKVTTEAAEVRGRLDEARKGFESAASQLDNLRAELDKFVKEKEQVSSSFNSLEERLSQEKSRLIKLESKKSFLEDLIARHEGFEAGVKALLESLEKNELQIDGIRGVLGNLIEPKKGYECVVEAALSEYAQCVISRNREDAMRAVDYLSTKGLGKATFIVMDELSVTSKLNVDRQSGDGILGRLADFVEVRDELRRMVANLLRDTYLVDTRETAQKLFDTLSSSVVQNIRLVTKQGEVFRKGFITVGFSHKGEDVGIIGRKTRLRETISELESTNGIISRIEKDKEEFSVKLEELKRHVNSLEEMIKERELGYHRKESELSSIEEANKKLQDEISLLKLEYDEISEEIKDSTEKKEELEKRLKDIELCENNTQNVLLNSQDLLKNFSKEREEIIVLVARMRTEVQALSKEGESLSQNLSMQRESLELYSRSVNQKTDEIELSIKKKDEFTQEIEELERERQELTKELETASEELTHMGSSKNRINSVVGDIEGRLNELYKSSDEKKETEHKYAMQKSEIGFKIETLKNRMNQLYKVDIDTEQCETESVVDWDSVRREIEELNRKLESMGTVNLVAIEEHKELEDRFNFLTHQREDLLKAKDDLQKAIANINKTAHKLFIETFEKIQLEFRNYFRYLFGGGQAEIFLLDEHDVLESGIEIVARPPGKKLQSITLLSGGEKALTAIALIFAIFKVRPSPFCLLDEVDAALDESNIDRFCKVLSEFTKKSQFIIITHNKGTIIMADVMYGITMEKSGISKIVSVKFQDESKKREVFVGQDEEAEKKIREKEEEVLA